MAERSPESVVLRWGHRPRDFRVTTHVALTARAFGAKRFILSDVNDLSLRERITKIIENWGGRFSIQIGQPWREVVKEWKSKGGSVVHLTMYGENLQTSNILERIRKYPKILILIGSKKVPTEFFSENVADFNVAVGNQPHSEVAALAIFLDRLYRGNELSLTYDDARLRVIPSSRGKQLIENRPIPENPRNIEYNEV